MIHPVCNYWTVARRLHHVEVGQRVGHTAERGRLRERVHGAQDRVLDEVHRPLLPGNALTPSWFAISIQLMNPFDWNHTNERFIMCFMGGVILYSLREGALRALFQRKLFSTTIRRLQYFKLSRFVNLNEQILADLCMWIFSLFLWGCQLVERQPRTYASYMGSSKYCLVEIRKYYWKLAELLVCAAGVRQFISCPPTFMEFQLQFYTKTLGTLWCQIDWFDTVVCRESKKMTKKRIWISRNVCWRPMNCLSLKSCQYFSKYLKNILFVMKTTILYYQEIKGS